MARTETRLTNAQIVTLAVSELGGATRAVDIEDVAILAYEIAPEKFGWRKNPDRIDLRVVQYALKDSASRRKGTPLLKGSLKHGYMLTTFGMEWIENNKPTNLNDLKTSSRRQSTAEKLSIEEARLLTSTAFIKFESGRLEEIKHSDFQEFARVNDYFPEHVREQRYMVVTNAVRGNLKLEELWRILVDRFVEGGI